MRFDSNKAWQDAVLTVSANKDVLWALAGVFFVLPSFAVAIAYPQPELPAGLALSQLLDRVDAYYTRAAPALVTAFAVGALGSLAILAMISDSRRPTVGQAMQIGAACVASVLAAVLIISLGLFFIGVALLTLAAITGSSGVFAATMFCWFGLMLYAGVRTALLLPIVVVEGVRNPLSALRRSWTLTQGHAGPLSLFLLLLLVASWVLIVVAMIITGSILAIAFAPETARVIAALISSALSAAAALIMVGVIAAVHQQLSGTPASPR